MYALQRRVVAHVRDGAPLENTGAADLRTREIEQAIYRSAASGRWQALGSNGRTSVAATAWRRSSLPPDRGPSGFLDRWTSTERNTTFDVAELAQSIALGGDRRRFKRCVTPLAGLVAPRRPNGEQEMPHTFSLLIGLLALLVLPSLSACNTARGMGEDVQALGRAMSGTAEEVEEDISGEEDESEGTTQ